MKVTSAMKVSPLRVAIGVAILGLVLSAWGPLVVNHTTTLAVVNSEIIRLSAPFQGFATTDLPPPGTRITTGAEIALLETAIPDERELERLRMEAAVAETRITRLTESLATLERHEADVRDRWRALVDSSREVLSRLRDEAEATRAAALARVRQAEVELELAEDMRRRGLYADTRVEAARSALAAFRSEADVASLRIETITARMRALERGVHLSDGYNDVPYNVQQLDRLLLLREQLLDRLAEERARLANLARAIVVEQRASDMRARFAQRADRPLVVWARHVAPGALVGPGTAMLDLIDCDRLFVDALLPDRSYPNILGARPRIRLSGGLVLHGEIVQMRGAGARDSGLPSAAQPVTDAVDRLMVRISLPPGHADLLQGDGGNMCGIGRQAEVSIPGNLSRSLSETVSLIGHLLSSLIMSSSAGFARN